MSDANEVALIRRQLNDLQMQVAFQDDLLQALNDVVAQQQRQIDQSTRLCEQLRAHLESAMNQLEISQTIERPPHY